MTIKTDRELLELAARAIGLKPHVSQSAMPGILMDDQTFWSPLEDDGDALRLAVKLRLLVDICADHTCVCNEKVDPLEQSHGKDGMEATRRAIVRAAAEIGESMP